METHKNLLVWKKSISLVTGLYQITKIFPKDELYGIVSQIRRAAVSVPANIAEGCARRSTKEYIQFPYVSLGSAVELETHLIISSNLSFINSSDLEIIQKELEEIIRMLKGLIRSLSTK